MGKAPAAYCLRQRILLYDPNDPGWLKRDRFMQSVGHACALPGSNRRFRIAVGVGVVMNEQIALVSSGETLRIDFGHFSRTTPLARIPLDFSLRFWRWI